MRLQLIAISVNCTVLTNMSHVDRFANLTLSLRLCGQQMPTSVNLLPEDVLREIFKYSVPPESENCHYKKIHFEPSCILVLTHVCSRWRQIALSMPFLWSTICVSNMNGDEVPFNLCRPNVEHVMHEWFSRAASVPRTLSIAIGPSNKEDLIPINTILASYLFRRLSVSEKRTASEPLIDLPNQALECLEDSNVERSSVKFPHDGKLSNFRSLSLRYVSRRGFQRLSVGIPWSQLRHLTLSRFCISSDLLFNVLKQCSYLEYCNIECLALDLPALEPFVNITLPNLQSFRFYFYNNDSHAMECLRRLAVPSVNTLYLTYLISTSTHWSTHGS
jgi:hypothetical protein